MPTGAEPVPGPGEPRGSGGPRPGEPSGSGPRGPGELCGIVLAAGEGQRLRPLTEVVPKALCPVGNVPLLDLALARFAGLGLHGPDRVAVNACWLGEQVRDHVTGRAHVSVEPGPAPLGTAGGLAYLRGWIAGRPVLVGNADAYLSVAGAWRADPAAGVAALLDGWDGDTVRLLGVPARAGDHHFGGYRFAGLSLLPWRWVAALPDGPSEAVGRIWRPAEAAGELTVVAYPGTFIDTGTPADYLAANLHAAGGGDLVAPDAVVTGALDGAVVGAGARVAGRVTRGVVWPGGHVAADEHLVDAVRFGRDRTVAAARLSVPE